MSRERLLLAGALLAITAASFFWFPGRTYLASDTQIYIPILEHLWNPSVLANDPMASRPHVTFTIYDEVAIAVRKITGLGFEPIVVTQEFLYRVLGIFGVFLIARALQLPAMAALFVAGVAALGASVPGPAVLTLEYEPVPRAFAMPFMLLSIGCVGFHKWTWASVAAAIAFLFHPPTAGAYCALFVADALYRRHLRSILPFAAAAIFMFALLAFAPQPVDGLHFLGRIDPQLEHMQRLRANYNWVSVWFSTWIWHYVALCAIITAAIFRLWAVMPRRLRVLFIGAPIAGMLSMPVSYFMLEKEKWMLTVQLQPGRYLVFVVLCAVLLATAAGMRAALRKRPAEAIVFLVLALAIPVQPRFFETLSKPLVVASLLAVAVIGTAAMWRPRFAPAAALCAAFVIVPLFGRDPNRIHPETPALDGVIRWAESATPPNAVFVFAPADRSLDAGVFRARALRPVYTDWKSGGQVNFLRTFATIWWDRWNKVRKARTLSDYAALGINYVVYRPGARPPSGTPVFESDGYAVYAAR